MAVTSHLAKLSSVPLDRHGSFSSSAFSQLPCNKFLHIQSNKASTSTSWSLSINGSRKQSKQHPYESWLPHLGPGLRRVLRRPWLITQLLFTPRLGARGYSSEVKSLFKKLGVQPLVIELDELGPQGPQLQKVLERLTGQHTVPNVFIGGKHIGGCTDTVKLHRKGELESLLTEANAKSEGN